MVFSQKLSNYLQKQPVWFISLFAAITSFGVYFCMYAFRKPFTAAGYTDMVLWGVDFKIWLVTAQVIGYMLSKFYGIRFISALQPDSRSWAIIKLIAVAWLALFLFAVTPAPYNLVFLFINGFPLGMIWGIVFSYLEGRKTTEFMGAVLSVSFIFSSGVVKSVGKSLVINWHISEYWMPFIVGALFIIPLVGFTWLLSHLPRPTEEDIKKRSKRTPMTKEERSDFVKQFLPGLLVAVSVYVLSTVIRDFRDNFANEIWSELGFGNDTRIFSKSEIPVSIIVLVCMSLVMLIKSNYKAFILNHVIIIAGFAIALVSTLMFYRGYLSPLSWMIAIGSGLYMSYVPFNCLYFERMIATYRIRGNVGFVMYIADSFGYLGSVVVLFIRQFMPLKLSWTTFFAQSVVVVSILGITGTLIAVVYFRKKYFNQDTSYRESVYV